MEKRIFEQDELLGITRIWHFDEDTDTAVIETIQNVQPIVETNKTEFNQVGERARWSGDGHGVKVASIPMNLFMELVGKGITRNQTDFKRWLNDPDNRHFRTRPGRV